MCFTSHSQVTKNNNNNNRITLRLCQNRSVKVGPYTTPIFIQHNLVIFTMLFYLIFFRNRLSNVYGMSKALTSKEIIQQVNCSFNFFHSFVVFGENLSLELKQTKFNDEQQSVSTTSRNMVDPQSEQFFNGFKHESQLDKNKIRVAKSPLNTSNKGFLDLNVLHFLTVHWCSEGKYTVPIDQFEM